MEIKTKYDVGQSVYVVKNSTKILEKSESCELCFGDGKIRYGSYSLQCPKCNGKGKLISQRKQVDVWKVLPQHKIISIRVSISNTNVGAYIRYKLAKFKGSVPEELLFASEKEAEQFCQNKMQENSNDALDQAENE